MCPALPHRNAASHRGISVFRNGWEPARRGCPAIAPGRQRPEAPRGVPLPVPGGGREVPAPVPPLPVRARATHFCQPIAAELPGSRTRMEPTSLEPGCSGSPYPPPSPASHSAGLNPPPAPPTLKTYCRDLPPLTTPRVSIRRPRAHRDSAASCAPVTEVCHGRRLFPQ